MIEEEIKKEELEIITIEEVDVKKLPRLFIDWYFDDVKTARQVTDVFKEQGRKEAIEDKDKEIEQLKLICDALSKKVEQTEARIKKDIKKMIEKQKEEYERCEKLRPYRMRKNNQANWGMVEAKNKIVHYSEVIKSLEEKRCQ
jgi:hypothetical protein